MKQFFSRLGTLAVAILGITCAIGLSACATKAVTGADGQVTQVATFNTAELNADTQAALFGLKTIEALPDIQALLTKNPAAKVKFDAAVANVQKISGDIKNATGGTVELNVGKTWAKDIAAELQVALDVANPVVGTFAPSAQKYVTLVAQAIPLIDALVQTFGQPVPSVPVDSRSFGAPMASPVAVRERIYAGA